MTVNISFSDIRRLVDEACRVSKDIPTAINIVVSALHEKYNIPYKDAYNLVESIKSVFIVTFTKHHYDDYFHSA